MLLRERLHQLVRGACRQALALELLDPRLGDVGSDSPELRGLLAGQLDGLSARVHERLLPGNVQGIPGLTDLLLLASRRLDDQLLEVGRQLGVKVRVYREA